MAALGKKVITNFLWRFCERLGSEGLALIVGIILARILDPANYATIAMAMSVISILNVFVDSGFGSALIQKKEADEVDFSTVFYFNIVSSLLLYGLIYTGAPLVADYYHNQELLPVIRVLSLTLLISGLKNVQLAYVTRALKFKRFFFSTLGGNLLAAIVGIAMAYGGYGVWALVAQQLLSSLVGTLILWFTVRWRPAWAFSWSRLQVLFSFGWKLLLSGLIDRVYTELRTFIIGKLYQPEELAYYNKGNQYPAMLVRNINSSIDSVLFPVMSAVQDDPAKIKDMTRKAITTSCYLIMPMMMGLAVTAEPVVTLILTDKWLPCVPFMRLVCFTSAFYPIHTANLNAIKAMGKSGLFLKLEIIKKVMGLAVLLPAIPHGVMAIAASGVVSSICCQIINSWPNKKLLNYGYLEQLKDLMPQIGLSCLMGAAVYTVNFLGLSPVPALALQIPLGVAIYWLGSRLFKLDSYTQAKKVLINMWEKRKKQKTSTNS